MNNGDKMSIFSKHGFRIIDLLSEKKHEIISQSIKKKINERLKIVTDNCYYLSDLKDYHKLNLTDDVHKQIVNASCRHLDFNDFIDDIKKNNSIKKILDECWGHHEFRLIWVGDLMNDTIKENYCTFRLARPSVYQDVGGIHLDKHVGGIKNLGEKNLLTLWIPIVGFDEHYTLKFAPESHQHVHPDNFIEEDKNYISMTYDDDYTDNFKYSRPKLKLGQGVIFDPNLLHGGSYNLGVDTRVSIELRLFNTETKYVFDS